MDARFNRADLINRIEAIAYQKDSIKISNMDAEKYIKKYIPKLPENTLIYLDPPYFNRSKGLYLDLYKKDDHERLAESIQTDIKRKWVLSYDGAEEIIDYYSDRKHFLYSLQYKASKVYKGTEIFIFGDDVEVPNSS